MDEATRRQVERRARHLCEYCRCFGSYSPGPFCVEHIHPQILGGSDDLANLAWSCTGCNGHKGYATEALDPITGEMVPLFHPRQQEWSEHFIWSADTLTIQGITAIGRATVERLQLNRMPLRNLRRLMREAGLHPPM